MKNRKGYKKLRFRSAIRKRAARNEMIYRLIPWAKSYGDARAEEAQEKIDALEVWERYAAYLLNHCEGETITEENLQRWLADMLESEKQTPVLKEPQHD